LNIQNSTHGENATSSFTEKQNKNFQLRPPIIMQILPALSSGGVERGTIDLAEAIVEAGGRSIVVSAGGQMLSELKRTGSDHYYLPMASKNPFIMWQNISQIVKIIESEQVDIVHARSRAPAWSAWYATRRTKKHFVTTFHGTYGYSNWFKRKYNEIMTKGDRVIAISNFIAGHIQQIYGIGATKIKIIPRGIDITKFNTDKVSQERRIQLANHWRLPDDKTIIILPGRLTRWKGQTVFIQAVAKLNREDIQCLMVGSTQGREDYRRELESEINQHGMQQYIHVIDHCDDMPAAYMLTDIVVSASTEPEAFGRVTAEAQALGRLVIGTNHGGSKETIIDGKTGWLVPPNDPDSLAKTLTKVIDLTKQKRAEITKNSVKHIHTNYSKDLMCSRILELYNELIKENII
jgi:glycosyltransferase involved in cell wall biosynthesis